MRRKVFLGIFVWAVVTLTYSAFASNELETQERPTQTTMVFNNLSRLNLHIIPMVVGIDEQEELNWCSENVEANDQNAKEFIVLLKSDIRNGGIRDLEMSDAYRMESAFKDLYELCMIADSHEEFLGKIDDYAHKVETLINIRDRLMDEMNTTL